MSSSDPIQTILVTGATGNTGQATLKAIQEKIAASENAYAIRAGIRGPEIVADKMLKLSIPLDYVNTAVDTSGEDTKANLDTAFRGVTTAILIPPGADRTKVSLEYVQAAKRQSVKNLILLSMAIADNEKTTFGKQFGQIEKAVKDTGINYSILRCPMFFEDQWNNVGPIANDSTISYPAKGDSHYVLIGVDDVGSALACLALQPEKHQMKTYTITTDETITNIQLAKMYSHLLNQQVKYHQVTREEAVNTNLGLGLEESQGMAELWDLVDKNESSLVKPTEDFKLITGKEPMKFKTFLEKANLLAACKKGTPILIREMYVPSF